MDHNDELIKKAYQLYNEKRDLEIDETALSTLNNLHTAIDEWDGNTDDLRGILFYKDYLVGSNMDAIAARGAATAIVENFISTMKRRSTASKVSELFIIRKEGPLNEGTVRKIAEVDLINHVINYPGRIR